MIPQIDSNEKLRQNPTNCEKLSDARLLTLSDKRQRDLIPRALAIAVVGEGPDRIHFGDAFLTTIRELGEIVLATVSRSGTQKDSIPRAVRRPIAHPNPAVNAASPNV